MGQRDQCRFTEKVKVESVFILGDDLGTPHGEQGLVAGLDRVHEHHHLSMHDLVGLTRATGESFSSNKQEK